MIDREFNVGDSPSVKVRIKSGRVRVAPGESGMVRVLVDTGDPTFEVTQRGDAIVAAGERSGRAEVTVHAPPMIDLDVATASGDITVIPAVSRLDIATASGAVEFDSATRLQVKTASGDVRGKRVDGEARCITVSGDIRILETADRVDVSTASGDITIAESRGSMSAASVSGDIRVDRLLGPELNAKSMSGGVRLGIPPGTRLDLDAHTLSGKMDLPTPSPTPQPPQREMSVMVRLVSGNLRIVRVD